MCGEAAKCRNLTICLFLTKTQQPDAMTVEDVLIRLKISRYEVPDDYCPHYAGMAPLSLALSLHRALTRL